MIDTITTHQSLPTRSSQTHQLELINLYFFQIVKERNSQWSFKRPNLNHDVLGTLDLGLIFWWRLTGSNRRPPACKAGALPAELNPQVTQQLV